MNQVNAVSSPAKAAMVDDLVLCINYRSDITASMTQEQREIIESFPIDLLEPLAAKALKGELPPSTMQIIRYGKNTVMVREMLRFFEYLPGENGHISEAMVRSLHHYSQIKQLADFSEADEMTRQQCVALLIVSDILCQYSQKYITSSTRYLIPTSRDEHDKLILVIAEDDLVELIVRRPNDAQRIASIITERQSKDGAFIETILDNTAIGEGTL